MSRRSEGFVADQLGKAALADSTASFTCWVDAVEQWEISAPLRHPVTGKVSFVVISLPLIISGTVCRLRVTALKRP